MREAFAVKTITVLVDGKVVDVQAGSTVIAALGHCSATTRRSVHGFARAPLCGMGICQECRVRIDGEAHRLACQTACREGMCIDTDEGAS
jgi:predicted molibdopterin-dependent oxidoreductase YjgC